MTPVLKNWYIIALEKDEGTVYYANGTVFGHTSPWCADGTSIHTSRVKNIVTADEDTLEIQTRNTLYRVKLNEYGTLSNICNAAAGNIFSAARADRTADALKSFGISAEIYAKMAELRRERFDQRYAVIESCDAKLATGEMYLALSANSDYYFDFGLIKQSEKTVFLHDFVHLGIHQDSVLLMNKYEIAASYFPYKENNLEFYKSLFRTLEHMNSGTRLGYLRNTGDMPLNIRFTWGKCVTLMPNEEIEVRYPETGSKDIQLTDETDKHPAMPL